MKKVIATCVPAVLFSSGYAGADGTWTGLSRGNLDRAVWHEMNEN